MEFDTNKVTNITIHLVAKLKAQLIKVNETVEIIVKEGTSFKLFLSIDQTYKELQDNPKGVTVKRVSIESSGVFINYKGENVIRLKNIILSKGGTAEVKDFEALNTISYLEAIESIIILISLLSRTNSQFERYGVLRHEKKFESTIIKGLTLTELNAKISEAVVSIIREKKNAIGGIDLEKAFGLKQK